MTVLSFQWETDDSPVQKDMHRFGIIERWEAGVTPGNPTLSNTFVALGTGAISSFTTDASTDAARANGTYSAIEGVSNATSEGTGATFEFVVDGVGATTVNITNRGKDYAPGDTILVLDSQLGGGGAADITVTISNTA